MTNLVQKPLVQKRDANRPLSHGFACPSRRSFCALLASACFGGRAAGGAGSAGPLVIISVRGRANAQALKGLRAELGNTAPLEVVEIASKRQLAHLGNTLAAKRPRLVIAVGIEARAAATVCPGQTPLISTMILLADTKKAAADKQRPSTVVGNVSLDMSVAVVCREWKQLVPGKTRLGILRNPRKNEPPSASLQAQAASAGCYARVVDCARPEDLLEVFLDLKNSVDFVWCMPDSALYTSATALPLLRASIEQRLPLVGFSESFVRWGAVMGVYPDFSDVGRQTAELARKWLAGEAFRAAQAPRMVRVAFNPRVAGLMGLQYKLPPEGDGRVMVLK